jgi:hypothetical protein
MNNINIEDTLPSQLEYVAGSSAILFNGSYYDCDEPFIIDDSVLVWEKIERCLPHENSDTAIRYLYVGETISLIFEAETKESGLAINQADVNARLCSNAVYVSCSDTATVNISIEELNAEAKIESSSPFFVDDEIQFLGSATGGTGPYLYYWDLDNNGEFDDSTVQNPKNSWGETGTYTVILKVVDDAGRNDTDSLTIVIQNRNPDLFCSGSINLLEVKRGSTQTASFTIENKGDPGSLLDWSIASYPDEWGEWEIIPLSGTGLTPEDGKQTIQVTIVVPNKRNDECIDSITIVNDNDPSDSCEIEVSVTTPRIFNPFSLLLDRIIERFPLLEWALQQIFY